MTATKAKYHPNELLPIILVLFSPILVTLLTPSLNYDFQAEGFWGKQIIWATCFVLTFFLAINKKEEFASFLQRNKLLLFFLGFAFFSIFWSPVPFVSLKRWLQFLGIVFFAIAAMTNPLGSSKILFTLRAYCVLTIVASFVLIMLNPSAYINEFGNWSGLSRNKNTLGSVCMISLAVFLPLLGRKMSFKQFASLFSFVLLTFLVLAKTNSATAIVSSLFVLGVYVVVRLQLPATIKMLFFPIPLLLGAFYIANLTDQTIFEFGLTSLGRDSTLTGRSDLWEIMIVSIQEHPYFGLGYNSFWVGEEGLSNYFISELWWRMNQAHSGYLDIANELGITGLFFFLLIVIQALKRCVTYALSKEPKDTSFLLIILGLGVANLTESTFCRLDHLEWIAFLIALVATTPIAKSTEFSWKTMRETEA